MVLLMAMPMTVRAAAEELGVSTSRIHGLIREKRLPATKVGVQLFIAARDLDKVRVRKAGRPRKAPAKARRK